MSLQVGTTPGSDSPFRGKTRAEISARMKSPDRFCWWLRQQSFSPNPPMDGVRELQGEGLGSHWGSGIPLFPASPLVRHRLFSSSKPSRPTIFEMTDGIPDCSAIASMSPV